MPSAAEVGLGQCEQWRVLENVGAGAAVAGDLQESPIFFCGGWAVGGVCLVVLQGECSSGT